MVALDPVPASAAGLVQACVGLGGKPAEAAKKGGRFVEPATFD